MRPLIFAVAILAAPPALAADSATHGSAAVTASGAAVGNLAASGVQTVAGIAAVPVGVIGAGSQAGGAVSTAGGESFGGAGGELTKAADQAITDAWGPLKVDDRVVVHPDPEVPYAAQKPAGR